MARSSIYPPSVTPGIPRLGQQPEGWIETTYGAVLEKFVRKADVQDAQKYQLVTAKRNRGGIVPRSELYGKEIKTEAQFYIRTDDFLISKRQIIHGACGIVPESLDGSIVSGEYSVLRVKPGLLLDYLKYHCHTVYFQQTCFQSSVGVDVEKMIFDLDKWFKFKVYLPPLPEQRKIAEILSTWDEAIDLTEQLIAAKQRRKQALMQRLLAGQVRFPGFEDEWVRRRVADFGNVVTGNTPPKDKPNYYEGEFPWTSPADMHSGKVTKTKTTLSPEGRKVARSVPKGSVLVTCIGSIGVNAIAEVDLAFNQQINAIVVNETYDNHFIYYLIDHHSQTLLSYAGTTSVPIINKSQFERIEYLVPSSVKEQNCIANILSACDDELALHQQKLAALRRQKQGLMQQLLTGRVRVVG